MDFLNFAYDQSTSPEFTLRNRISRAYYGAYHNCLLHYDSDPSVDTSSKSHAGFIRSLRGSSNSNNRKLGNKLYQMKSQRVKADYSLDLTINKSDLSVIILDAQSALKRLI
jgi:uncharacterized protein (UPF0332 family)